jgi:cobalamin synthase
MPNPMLESKINGPATGLIVYGVISAILAFGNAALCVLTIFGANPMANNQQQQFEEMQGQMPAEQAEFVKTMATVSNMFSGPIGAVTNTAVLIVGIFTVLAAMKMKKFQGHTGALVFSVLACIPCTSGCCLLGLPIGIWAIVVLVNSEVKAAFTS